MKINQVFFIKYLKSYVIAILAFILFSGILFFFQKDIGGKTFFTLLCLVVSYYSYHNIKKEPFKKISEGILIGLATALFVVLILQTIKAAISDSQWDFMCFYMQGLLGVHHLNFYDPNSFNILLREIDFHPIYDNSFKLEILDVGFLSPPITMLFFAPLASLDFQTARIVLSILIFIFIIANSILSNVVFINKNERSVYSGLFIFIIIMVLPGTITTINYNQTNFFLLFFLILTMHNLKNPTSGIYLALSIIIKPITGILILFFIINKKWKSVIYFCVTGIILLGITAFLWGGQNIIAFFQSPPTQRLPHYLYEQGVNQSLLATFTRNFTILGLSQNIIRVIYYLSASILLILSCVVSKKLNKINIHLSFLPFILCMLMIYPSSLMHYMVYLTPLLIYFLLLKHEKKYFLAVILISMCFLGTEAFFTYLTLWLFLYYVSLSNSKEPGNTNDGNEESNERIAENFHTDNKI